MLVKTLLILDLEEGLLISNVFVAVLVFKGLTTLQMLLHLPLNEVKVNSYILVMIVDFIVSVAANRGLIPRARVKVCRSYKIFSFYS